jgi:hypothetical protein
MPAPLSSGLCLAGRRSLVQDISSRVPRHAIGPTHEPRGICGAGRERAIQGVAAAAAFVALYCRGNILAQQHYGPHLFYWSIAGASGQLLGQPNIACLPACPCAAAVLGLYLSVHTYLTPPPYPCPR